MPRVCTICAHPEHPAIDAALVAGEANRRIAARYRLTETSVRRHAADHLVPALTAAKDAADAARADTLLAQVGALHAKALGILARAETAGDLRTALGAIGQARAVLELLAKLRGELDERPQVNVLVAPEWLALRVALLGALAPYPDARAAVVEALTGREPRP